jgi:hypothetical protein
VEAGGAGSKHGHLVFEFWKAKAVTSAPIGVGDLSQRLMNLQGYCMMAFVLLAAFDSSPSHTAVGGLQMYAESPKQLVFKFSYRFNGSAIDSSDLRLQISHRLPLSLLWKKSDLYQLIRIFQTLFEPKNNLLADMDLKEVPLLGEWDQGVFSSELQNQSITPRDISAADTNKKIQPPKSIGPPPALSSGTYRGTKIAMTQIYNRIEHR